MNRTAVAKELLAIAKELIALPWTQLERGTSTSQRNTAVLESNASFAPKLNLRIRQDAQGLLAEQGFRISSRNDLKWEWSEYLVLVDPEMNANKYHYYVVYSYPDATGVTRYSAFNCSGRIGFVERVYDLTQKVMRGPATSASAAQRAAEVHMRTKLAKGYEPMPMVRG